MRTWRRRHDVAPVAPVDLFADVPADPYADAPELTCEYRELLSATGTPYEMTRGYRLRRAAAADRDFLDADTYETRGESAYYGWQLLDYDRMNDTGSRPDSDHLRWDGGSVRMYVRREYVAWRARNL